MELVIRALSKQYPHKLAVDRVSLTLTPGIYGLLGANGAGKTTLMRMLCGILHPTGGEISLDGLGVAQEEYRACLGYLPQDFGYYPGVTGEEFLWYMGALKGLRSGRESIRAVIEAVHLGEKRRARIRTLSGGQSQRVGIAQALLGDPEVVILDEPTVGLDPKQIMEIRALIQSLGKDHTVILSSHILSEVQAVCQTILILSKGRLVACDTPENLEKRFAGTTTVELTAEATAEEVRAILAPLDHILEVTTREEPRGRCGVVLETDGEDALCREIFFAFSRAQKALLRMTTAQTSLEEIFLELTAEAPVVQLPGEGQRQDGEEAEG